jgi:hypothetical protein
MATEKSEGRAEIPGGGASYDPQKKRYVGTWIGSMMTHLWVYDGTLDPTELTLEAASPNMVAEGKLAQYKDLIEFKSDDPRVLTSQMLGDDGQRSCTERCEAGRVPAQAPGSKASLHIPRLSSENPGANKFTADLHIGSIRDSIF